MQALALATAGATDVIIAYGGGSAIGLGKAVALELHKPLVAIPTTYSGSEMTDIVG
jgi:maleylacetate reductase